MTLRPPMLFDKSHKTSTFDCGSPPLNEFLKRFALANNASGASKTFAATRDEEVVGYYSLCTASAEADAVPSRIIKGLPRNPIPLLLLARLAVDISEQKGGIGKGLLKDAFLRCAQAADIVGIRALLVHAKDENAKSYYLKFGFEPSPIDERHLYLLMKDLKENLKK